MPKVKTIILDGTETTVKFEKGYPYYVITNMGDGELYASGSPGITAYADGVYTILHPAGYGNADISRTVCGYGVSPRRRYGSGTRRGDCRAYVF